MSISDIITILSLIIAIVAIISEKKRKHLLLKFSVLDYCIFLLSFIFINYFVFYPQFYSKELFLNFLYFDNFGINNPKHYSYLISIATLILILIRIYKSFYPNNKKQQVIKYYSSLIENDEILLLIDLIERYHLNHIINLISINSGKLESVSFLRTRRESRGEKFLEGLKNFWRFINRQSKLNKFDYAKYVLFSIINNVVFIKLASNKRPYFFSEIIRNFTENNKHHIPQDLTNNFLREIFKEKNFWLIKELKESQNFDSGQPEFFFKNNKLLEAFLKNVSVAKANEIWRPLGEIAIEEIENEKYNGYDSKLYQEYRGNNEILWDFQCFLSIVFFQNLITENITQNYKGSHFWLFYYNHITNRILSNFQEIPPKDFEKVTSYYHHLLDTMNENLLHWLKLSKKHNSDRYFDIISCVGSQVDCMTKSEYVGEGRKLELIDSLFSAYCSSDETDNMDSIRNEIANILIRPSMMTDQTDPYYSYVEKAWNDFDKIPHRAYGNVDLDYFEKFKKNVIIPLQLDPDKN